MYRVKAILWAGENGAEIISMSFGFPRDHPGISQAIQTVSSREGGAIFFASAGNSPYEDETFPARHPDVISIYATNKYGTFAESNCRRPGNGSDIFGTFSDGVSADIHAEFEREYRGVCQPGSSISTAVAAGVAALTLAYVDLLPELVSSPPSGEMLRALGRVRGSSGMRAVLRAMSQDMAHGRRFINPAQFWRLKSQDEARYHAISASLWDVDRGM
jgi:subtilisin family serine protease